MEQRSTWPPDPGLHLSRAPCMSAQASTTPAPAIGNFFENVAPTLVFPSFEIRCLPTHATYLHSLHNMILLLDLPFEIVILIIDSLIPQFTESKPGNEDLFLATQTSLSALSRTNKWFYGQLEGRLYQFNVQYCGQTSLAFGAFHGYEIVVQKSLASSVSEIISDIRFPSRDYEVPHSPLCWAAQGGHVSMVHLLVENGVDLHKVCSDSRCDAKPLGQAARYGHLNMMKDLYLRGLNPTTIMWETVVTTPVSRRKSTLRLAAEGGHIPCVDYALSVGAYQDLDARQWMHKIGLIVPATVANGHMECAMFLLSHSGILEKAQFCRCGNKLALALASDLPILSIMLKDPGNMEKYGRMLLYLAAVTGCSPLFEEMVRLGAHPDTRFRGGNTPLCLAIIEEREAEDIRQLLALGAGVNVANSQNRTALYLATVFRSKGVMEVLLDGGADLEACGYRSGMLETPLFRAVHDFGGNAPSLMRTRRRLRSQSNEIVSLLLKHGANPNYSEPRSGITPLWLAVRGQLALRRFPRHDLVELLLEHSADPKLATRNQSLLFWAIPFHRYDTIKLLLDYGADPNDYSRDFDGSITHYSGKALSPLARAMQLGHYGTAELLLDNGADPHAPYWKKEISLVNATKSMKCSFIQKMIDTGFDVNESAKGQTPLHMAVWKGNVEVAELLLRNGANPNIEIGGSSCSSTRSILDWAIDRNYKAIVELLCAYGARRLDDIYNL